MAHYDENARRLSVKLVYYGPSHSGKTACLQWLERQLSPQIKGPLLRLDDGRGDTLIADRLLVGFRAPSGVLIQCQLYSVPGAAPYNSTRQVILEGADGVLFIADSLVAARSRNAGAFADLQRNCFHLGLDFEKLPLVIQYNKRDLTDIVPAEELLRSWEGGRLSFSSAIEGRGVVSALTRLLAKVYQEGKSTWQVLSCHGLSESDFIHGITGLSAREVERDGV